MNEWLYLHFECSSSSSDFKTLFLSPFWLSHNWNLVAWERQSRLLLYLRRKLFAFERCLFPGGFHVFTCFPNVIDFRRIVSVFFFQFNYNKKLKLFLNFPSGLRLHLGWGTFWGWKSYWKSKFITRDKVEGKEPFINQKAIRTNHKLAKAVSKHLWNVM